MDTTPTPEEQELFRRKMKEALERTKKDEPTRTKIVIAEEADGTFTLRITEHRTGEKTQLRYASHNIPSAVAAVSQLIDWQAGIIII